jgi:hypothetical protein
MQRTEKDLLDRVIRALDRGHRYLRSIYEFSSDPDCVYRLSIENAPRNTALPDGTVFHKGESVGILHIWGEHVPVIPPTGVNLAWATKMARLLKRSTNLLAQHAATEKSIQSIPAFGNDAFFPYTQTTMRFLERIGFAVLEDVPADRLHQKIRVRLIRYWTWLLRRTFNRQSARKVRPSDLQSRPIWLSRRALLEKYTACQADLL